MSKKPNRVYIQPPEPVFKTLISRWWPSLYDYHEDIERKTLSFEIQGRDVEYDKLEKLSMILDTKLINFHGKRVVSGGCETCASEEDIVTIKCSGVRFLETDPIPDSPQITGTLRELEDWEKD